MHIKKRENIRKVHELTLHGVSTLKQEFQSIDCSTTQSLLLANYLQHSVPFCLKVSEIRQLYGVIETELEISDLEERV